MFEGIAPQPEDKIIALMGAYAADPRPEKVDLGVGVYKDDQGQTPILRAVKAAEAHIHRTQTTKTYTRLLGNAAFIADMQNLVLGQSCDTPRLTGAQAPGGTGSLRILFELILMAKPETRFHISTPSWPNHAAILTYLGHLPHSYRYFDPATRTVAFDAMMQDLERLGPGDVVVLHGCCHNPTGADLTVAQWQAVTECALARGWMPLIDLAYQGMGNGLDEDAAGLRHMASAVPEMMIAVSCSKTFGLYRDRAGAAIVLTRNTQDQARAEGALTALNRMAYSFPPDPPAAIVSHILSTPALNTEWRAELAQMQGRICTLRNALAKALRRAANSERFDFIAQHRGMFSLVGASPEQVEALRRDHAIYMIGDGRMNIAGLPESRVDDVARAIVTVGI